MWRTLDLFCGAAGGWTLGLHHAGFHTVAACEFDPWRRAVFARNNPGVRMYDDVRTLTARQLIRDLGYLPEVIVGSPPCQDASSANAGNRTGLAGARTGLFSEFIRLVREVRPRWIAAENVPGVRTVGADWVLSALAAAGYPAWPLVVGAVHAGAPHLRKRVWFIGCRSDLISDAAYARFETSDVWGGRPSSIPGTPQDDGLGGFSADATQEQVGSAGQPRSATHDPDATPLHGFAQPRREPDGVAALATPDTSESIAAGGGVRIEGGAGGRRKFLEIFADADAAQISGRPGPDLAQPEPKSVSGDADETRLEVGQGIAGDDDAQQPPAIGTGPLDAWREWNGGPPSFGGMDDGFSAALSSRRGVGRACLAAYGDCVLPQITKSVGQAMRLVDGMLTT